MRLMPPDELIDTAEVLFTDMPEVYSPAAAAYIFTDDNSNWAGVYDRGALAGLATVLDHDGPSRAPRWRDLASLLHRLVEAGRRMQDEDDEDWVDFTWLRTDYPLTPDSPDELIAEAGPRAMLHLERFRASVAGRTELDAELVADMESALYLLPPGHPGVLAELLRSPYQYVRYTTLTVIGRHRATELTADVAAYARACLAGEIGGGGSPYGHFLRAYAALHAIGATAAAQEVGRDCPATWSLPRADKLDQRIRVGPTVGAP
jgi:hypothetical protein